MPVGESVLFFGCRDPLQDFLYEDELRGFEAAGVTRLYPAFSREPGQPKTYVQQAIREQADDVWRLLQQEAVIFVCGEASRMAPDVRQAFAERVPGAHRHLGRRRAGLAHRAGRRPALPRGHLGVRSLI